MLLYLSLLGLLLSVLLMYFNGRRFQSSIYLGAFFFLVSTYALSHYVFVYAHSAFWISIMYVHITFLAYLTGPMAFFYIRSLVRDNARLSRKDLVHFLPALLHILVSIPYIIKPFSYKLQVGQAIATDISFLFRHKANLITEYTGANTAMYLSRPLLATAYTLASVILWYTHLARINKSPLVAQRRVIHRWVTCFLAFQLLLFAGFASGLLFSGGQDIILYLVAFSLVALILAPFLFPQVLYGLPDFRNDHHVLQRNNRPVNTVPEIQRFVPLSPAVMIGREQPVAVATLTAGTTVAVMEEEDEQDDIAYKNIQTVAAPRMQLDTSYVNQLSQAVDLFMENEQPFLQPGFNMLKLAHLVDVPAHHLGYLFREHKQVSFNDYRNTYRVSYAQTLMAQGLFNELTLEAIGLQSGFSSRSAFFKSFKKVTGISPSEFIAGSIK